jgi:hypothetical protein
MMNERITHDEKTLSCIQFKNLPKHHVFLLEAKGDFYLHFITMLGYFVQNFPSAFRNIKIHNRATILGVAYFPFLGQWKFSFMISKLEPCER